ncbi:Pre-mRNA-splicing factor 18 [Fukomys damarensis]|nr:Pre-mRNA-splicing factor 18 [Fukomys damarensis]
MHHWSIKRLKGRSDSTHETIKPCGVQAAAGHETGAFRTTQQLKHVGGCILSSNPATSVEKHQCLLPLGRSWHPSHKLRVKSTLYPMRHTQLLREQHRSGDAAAALPEGSARGPYRQLRCQRLCRGALLPPLGAPGFRRKRRPVGCGSPRSGSVENKKYFKRSELAKKEEEAYFERCGYKIQPKEEDQKPLTSSNPVLELELAEEKLPMTLSRQECLLLVTQVHGPALKHLSLRHSASSVLCVPKQAAEGPDLDVVLTSESVCGAVIRRLRERGEPIRLFGETDYDAFQRLRKIEILTPEVNKGLRNDLKAALDKIDQQYLNEIVGGQEPGEEDTQNDLKVHEENTTIEELEALGESLGQGDDHQDMDIITKFLKFLLGVWAKELNAREDYVKRSVQGKLNSATQKQTESYLRPLFRKLRKRNLPADIKESITDIIKFMLQREYVKANDAYLQMAIGNAPWPIGVTMVGIHARTGREKIFSKHVAHVLNDETQRKYIQGLKRLMTICQKHFPTDPSKCVEYNALTAAEISQPFGGSSAGPTVCVLASPSTSLQPAKTKSPLPEECSPLRPSKRCDPRRIFSRAAACAIESAPFTGPFVAMVVRMMRFCWPRCCSTVTDMASRELVFVNPALPAGW